MKNDDPKYGYIEWKTPDEMHFSSLQWQSELNFIHDEHRFYEDMLREYTIPIIESHLFSRIRGLIFKLTDSQNVLKKLQQEVKDHINRLQQLMQKSNEPKEENLYRQEHRKILQELIRYSGTYKQLKKDIFEAVSQAIKQQKQGRLLK